MEPRVDSFGPGDALAVLPDSLLPATVCFDKRAFSMLFAGMPLAVVRSTVAPVVLAVPLFFVIDEGALIVAAIAESENAIAVHLAIVPVSFV